MAVPTAGSPDSPPAPRLCNRCKEAEATLDLRTAETVCQSCFANYVSTKAIKRLEVMQRETRTAGHRLPPGAGAAPAPQRYVVALSCGPSSTALLHILYESLRRHEQQGQGEDLEQGMGKAQTQRQRQKQKQKQQAKPRFEMRAVHVVFDADDAGDDDDDEDVNGAHDGGVEQRHYYHRSHGGHYRYHQAGTDRLLDRYRARFPGLEIEAVGLSSVVGSPSIDWSALPLTTPPPPAPVAPTTTSAPTADPTRDTRRRRKQLAEIFARLPSATSRADVQRLLTRHALLAAAAAEKEVQAQAQAQAHDGRDQGQNGQDVVLLLGHSTTALAALTLSEAAKGRGFSLPWVVNDGAAFPVASPTAETKTATTATTDVPVYYPLREIFRKELLAYASNTTPPLTDILSPPTGTDNSSGGGDAGAAAVVSHKDLSIDDVMARYFGEVEASYPSVVANVVRTTGKLARTAPTAGAADGSDDRKDGREEEAAAEGGESEGLVVEGLGGGRCGLCGIALDKSGDARWRGEIGEEGSSDETTAWRRGLCYGCERSTRA
ncbi:Cytoplasmic tRNA 2-thiolation protein 2 [Diatrype stigma]|uniref:Cytoplasmic tRNA 2-thiolation protein 2 n=1 Tax=Diatrype stigma TaxID=117547 RepID=A0AAN9UFX6_9PEZI